MLAWGARVSWQFRKRVNQVGSNLKIEPSFLMACMAFETGNTFDPSIRNAAGSGATGLIQFMPGTAQALGTTTDRLAAMSATRQLDYVEKYFLPRKGRLASLEDLYMAILWPAAIGKPLDYVLFRKNDALNPKRYVQNAGLDYNKDGDITKAEAAMRVRQCLDLGLKKENGWPRAASRTK
ncbi:MAG: transglycosylase SLT domain-containing protein [Betaproteobacteria bacterium]